jgi:hypothetical protein
MRQLIVGVNESRVSRGALLWAADERHHGCGP